MCHLILIRKVYVKPWRCLRAVNNTWSLMEPFYFNTPKSLEYLVGKLYFIWLFFFYLRKLVASPRSDNWFSFLGLFQKQKYEYGYRLGKMSPIISIAYLNFERNNMKNLDRWYCSLWTCQDWCRLVIVDLQMVLGWIEICYIVLFLRRLVDIGIRLKEEEFSILCRQEHFSDCRKDFSSRSH